MNFFVVKANMTKIKNGDETSLLKFVL